MQNHTSPQHPTFLTPYNIAQMFWQMAERLQTYYQQSSTLFPLDNFLLTALTSSSLTLFQENLSTLTYEPEKLAHATQAYLETMAKLCQQMAENFKSTDLTNSTALDTFIKPLSHDRRFRDDLWQTNPYFDFLKQSYLLWNQWMRNVVHCAEGLDEKSRHRLDFYTRQMTDFFSPSNFLWTNPKALQKIVATGGQSLVKGVENFFRDLENGQGNLDIKRIDEKAFTLGETLAVTPGEIIFQNDLMQLIHYIPVTSLVYQTPLLLVPPCINKYYIFDLRPENSFVQWCLRQGFQVLVVSWINPDESLAKKTFHDYVCEGIHQAVDVIKETSKQPLINALGFCIGGNMLACAAALEAAQDKNSFVSLTYLATLFDFSLSGDLLVFIDENFLAELEERMKQKGFMEGKILAQTFNFLRANDLIWGFIENNYLLGEEPAAFDFLYWNADSTNVPMAMYSFYLRKMFLQNLLKEPGQLVLDKTPLDLGKVSAPTYILNTKDDHIAPWACGYAGANLFQHKARFVLGDSGHIAGVFNHPTAAKYGYWTNENVALESAAWIEQATPHKGSWWSDWQAWLTPFLGKQVSLNLSLVTRNSDENLGAREKAPGSYVLKKSA